MAHFRGTLQGSSRQSISRLGGKDRGIRVAASGWNRGVRVIAYHENGRDTFKVYATGGSNGRVPEKLIATVTDEDA